MQERTEPVDNYGSVACDEGHVGSCWSMGWCTREVGAGNGEIRAAAKGCTERADGSSKQTAQA